MNELTPRAEELLEYAQQRDWFTTRDMLLDIDMNSGSGTRRITELRDRGYVFDEEWRRRKDTDRRYKAWRLNMDLSRYNGAVKVTECLPNGQVLRTHLYPLAA